MRVLKLLPLSILLCTQIVFCPLGSLASDTDGAADSIPIRNFDEVTPTLWRGAQPDEDGLRWLAAHDVKTVVDLRKVCTDHEREVAKDLGLRYVRIPLWFGAPDNNSVESFLALAQTSKEPMFIHCAQGQDRTGMLVGVYRMVVQKWPFASVYQEMRKFGFKPWFFGLRSTVKHAIKKFGSAE